MKILVCGSRNFKNYDAVISMLWQFQDEIPEVISGGALGADSLAERWADYFGCKKTIIKPDWDKHGKSAGMIRNKKMIDLNPDFVIAFWDGKSAGTKNTISLAKQNKIATIIYYA